MFMDEDLFSLVKRHTDLRSTGAGAIETSVPGLSLVRQTLRGTLQHAINRPLVALVVQGRKRVTIGADSLELGAGESMLISADIPTVTQITEASQGAPYYSLVVDLDLVLIETLVAEMGMNEAPNPQPLRIDPTEAEVRDAAIRLLRLFDRPTATPILQAQLLRELHYWLLVGKHGAAIRNLGVAGSHAQRIGRAVALIRAGYDQPLSVDQLAEVAGMSPSSFHQHFRAITSLSPLQFQKQLRLIEAKRRMLAEGAPVSTAAYGVGYESVPQFTREYGRMFGAPPVRDIKDARARTSPAT